MGTLMSLDGQQMNETSARSYGQNDRGGVHSSLSPNGNQSPLGTEGWP